MTFPKGTGQLSLVALFGDKKDTFPELWQLIQELQSGIAKILGNDIFQAYSEQRVHATIIGLEGWRSGHDVFASNVNQNFRQLKPIDLELVIDFLLGSNNMLPIKIKVGGYLHDHEYSFTSQDNHPYLRSFSIQGETAVAMGWPCKNNLYTSDLNKLRRAFNKFNITHKYHGVASAYDNDFFFVLGNVTKSVDVNIIAACETLMRDILSRADIPLITINSGQLKIIPYISGDSTFKMAKSLTLQQAKKRIVELKRFYPEIDFLQG